MRVGEKLMAYARENVLMVEKRMALTDKIGAWGPIIMQNAYSK